LSFLPYDQPLQLELRLQFDFEGRVICEDGAEPSFFDLMNVNQRTKGCNGENLGRHHRLFDPLSE